MNNRNITIPDSRLGIWRQAKTLSKMKGYRSRATYILDLLEREIKEHADNLPGLQEKVRLEDRSNNS